MDNVHRVPSSGCGHILAELRPLTLPTGSMWPQFTAYRRDGIESEVFYIVRDGEIVAWAHVFPRRIESHRHEFHVYVRDDLRQQGLGRTLYEAALTLELAELKVYRWDMRATAFYNRIGA